MVRRLEPTITMLPIEKIRPHERHDRDILNAISTTLQSEGMIHDPIIVDSGSYMILDGTHRFWALASLGCQSIPVALYDYLSNNIRVGCWYRCVAPPSKVSAGCAFGALETSRDEAISLVVSRRAHLATLCRERSEVIRARRFDVFEAYNILSEVEESERSEGRRVEYATEADAIALLQRRSAPMVLAPPPILKEEAIYSATTGKLFPKKSTRHMLPSRPLGIDVPIDWLSLPPAKADRLLRTKLSSGSFRRVRAGSITKGRRYEEEVYIYAPRKP